MWKPIILDVECIVCNKTLQKINHDPREVTRKMGKISTYRRSRTPNWSGDEKQYLLELIKEYKEVIVTKSNNGPNHSEEKDVAWNEILGKLAGKFGNKFSGFSIKKVKTQWQNMKRIAREEINNNGSELQKYTKQSFEVCNILQLIKDGVLKKENEDFNETTISANIEIKTECIDEDISEPSCSNVNDDNFLDISVNKSNERNPLESPALSAIEHMSETNDSIEHFQDHNPNDKVQSVQNKVSVDVMTDAPYLDGLENIVSLRQELAEFLKSTKTEKLLKLESLKDERQVVRAMRETAELNKIIAEQKLKHILWIKKQEMAMYSGEPGSGAGQGGGGGGSIREAGGSFGKMEAAREDQYFYKKQKEQIANLKCHLDKEISFHQEQIKRHEDAIRRHKKQMEEMDGKPK